MPKWEGDIIAYQKVIISEEIICSSCMGKDDYDHIDNDITVDDVYDNTLTIQCDRCKKFYEGRSKGWHKKGI